MTILVLVVQLVVHSLPLAAVCFAVYLALRALSLGSRFLLILFGYFSVLVWMFVFFVLWNLFSTSPGAYTHLPMLYAGTLWLISMAGGAWAVQVASHHRLNRNESFLFCSLYLLVAHAVGIVATQFFGLFSLGRLWGQLSTILALRGTPELVWYWASAFAYWCFPLGAPLAEIGMHNLRRTLTNWHEMTGTEPTESLSEDAT